MRRVWKFLGVAAGCFFAATFLWVLALKWAPVLYTPLMAIRAAEYRQAGETHAFRRQWVPIESVSPHMVQAVVASEDGKFMLHHGFDWEGIRLAIRNNRKGGQLHGGSTISQQVAKNVFLWPGRSYVRKGLEAYFTVLIEMVWGKERIMEVYLNVVEMGRHVYGVEAGARHHYGHGAKSLSRREAAGLAALLPSPRYYRITGGYVQRRIDAICRIMLQMNPVRFD